MSFRSSRNLFAAVLAGGFLAFSATTLAAPVELTLEESIRLALANNPAIKVAEADLTNASWKVSEVRAGRMPSLSFSYSANRSDSSASLDRMDKYTDSLNLSLPLYTGGRVEGLIDQAKLGKESAGLGVAKSRQQIRLDATTAYFNLLQARNLVTLNEESVARLQAHLKNVQAQYDVGTVAKSDVLRSEVELANAEQNLIKARNSHDLAVASLNNVAGLPMDTEIHVKEELRYEKKPVSVEDSIKYSLANRPELGQARAGADIADRGIDVARSGWLPTVSLSASNSSTDVFHSDTDSHGWSVGVSLGLNVFDAGLTKAKVKEAEATKLKADLQEKQSRDSVELEVRQAILNMNEAEKRIETSQVAVVKAEEDYKIAQVRYNAGVGTNLDVIDSQVALTQAKTNYVQALYDYNTSRAKLDRAMGVAVK